MKHVPTILFIFFVLASCKNNNTTSTQDDASKNAPKATFESVFKTAYGQRVTNVADTLVLGYYTGMSKSQITNHTKNLAQSKKLSYKQYKGYVYQMPLTHYEPTGKETKTYAIRVLTEHYDDTLKTLTLRISQRDNRKNQTLSTEDLDKNLGPLFVEKGYLGKTVNHEMSLQSDSTYGLQGAHWKGEEFRYVKNNILIRIWRGDSWDSYGDVFITYYDMSVLYKEQRAISKKQNDEAKKAAEEDAAREALKADYLRDF